MWQYFVKVVLTALIVVGISEIAKRSSFWAAALASLPLTSLLAFVWIYLESSDTQRIAALSHGVFWLVIPSLPLFLILPALLRSGLGFWPSMAIACVSTAAAYFVMVWSLWGGSVLISEPAALNPLLQQMPSAFAELKR